jgi:hypothetical protein
MKRCLILVAATLLSIHAIAQTKPAGQIKLNLAADGYIPIGSAAKGYNFGPGASIKLEVPVAQALYVTATAGFVSLKYKDDLVQLLRLTGNYTTANSFVPLKIGARYYVAPQVYLEGGVGGAFGTRSGLGNYYVYTPGAGFIIPIEYNYSFDIGLRYEGWIKEGNTPGFVGVHAAFKFGL